MKQSGMRNYQPFSDHSENEEASHVLIHVVPENKCKQLNNTCYHPHSYKFSLFICSSMESHKGFGCFLYSSIPLPSAAWICLHDAPRVLRTRSIYLCSLLFSFPSQMCELWCLIQVLVMSIYVMFFSDDLRFKSLL